MCVSAFWFCHTCMLMVPCRCLWCSPTLRTVFIVPACLWSPGARTFLGSLIGMRTLSRRCSSLFGPTAWWRYAERQVEDLDSVSLITTCLSYTLTILIFVEDWCFPSILICVQSGIIYALQHSERRSYPYTDVLILQELEQSLTFSPRIRLVSFNQQGRG